MYLVPEGTVAFACSGIHLSAGESLSSESEKAPEMNEYPSPKNLINKNVYPTDKQDLKVDEDKGSALSSMGLKPKIVH